jgi:hypothetical protein
MENSFQTSFIPKKPINSSSANTRKQPTNFFTLIAVFILLGSIVLSGGLFLYKIYLNQQIDSYSASLVKSRDFFEKDTIDELELFDKRSKAVKQVLSTHIVLSPLFELIGNLTVPSVQYTKFTHNTTDKGFSVSMSGLARDYKSIALQADVFNTAKGRFFKNVIFSNLTKDKNNYVQFDIEFDVDPSLLSYENSILVEQGQSAVNDINQAPILPDIDSINNIQ